MKIYFAGSIRGGRDDAELYAKIIAFMKEKGHTVLTEHIGAPTLTAMGEVDKSDKTIYTQDTSWLLESDVVIAECSTASLGVGYELAFAETHGKPVHIFYNSGRGILSAMLTGDDYFTVHYYTEPAELFAELEKIL